MPTWSGCLDEQMEVLSTGASMGDRVVWAGAFAIVFISRFSTCDFIVATVYISHSRVKWKSCGTYTYIWYEWLLPAPVVVQSAVLSSQTQISTTSARGRSFEVTGFVELDKSGLDSH